jgi:hypothetical protein
VLCYFHRACLPRGQFQSFAGMLACMNQDSGEAAPDCTSIQLYLKNMTKNSCRSQI